MTILLAGNLTSEEKAEWLALLRRALPDERIETTAAGVAREAIDVAIVANPSPGELADLPALRLVQSLWAGVDRLLASGRVPPGALLARLVDPAMTRAMVETASWAVLGLQRDFFRYARQQHEQRWLPHAQARAADTPVAVLGLGTMGSAVARQLAAQGHPVRGWSTRERQLPGVQTSSGMAALPGVLGASQIVVNLLPLTPATRRLFDAPRLALLPPGASLVNLGRGAHVDESALLDALDSGRVRHAVLDVFEHEPLPPGHRFWTHPAVSVLPHIAAQTDPRTAAERAAANVRRWRAGEPLADLVDRERGY